MTENPKLHIPQPTARPGDPPDFSYIDLSPAGAVDRPPVDAAVRDIERLTNRRLDRPEGDDRREYAAAAASPRRGSRNDGARRPHRRRRR